MVRKDNMPGWVYWGLWGIGSRRAGFAYLAASFVLSLIIVPYGVMTNDYVLCLFVIAPVWYWQAIRWVDINSSWKIERD